MAVLTVQKYITIVNFRFSGEYIVNPESIGKWFTSDSWLKVMRFVC